jgi:hypothetical protein
VGFTRASDMVKEKSEFEYIDLKSIEDRDMLPEETITFDF